MPDQEIPILLMWMAMVSMTIATAKEFAHKMVLEKELVHRMVQEMELAHGMALAKAKAHRMALARNGTVVAWVEDLLMKMAMVSMTEGPAHRTALAKDEVVEEAPLVLKAVLATPRLAEFEAELAMTTVTVQNSRPGAAVWQCKVNIANAGGAELAPPGYRTRYKR